MNDATIAKLRTLPVDERLRLIEEVWSSLSDATDKLEVPDWHRDELERRAAAHLENPAAAKPWTEVKAEILRTLDK